MVDKFKLAYLALEKRDYNEIWERLSGYVDKLPPVKPARAETMAVTWFDVSIPSELEKYVKLQRLNNFSVSLPVTDGIEYNPADFSQRGKSGADKRYKENK